MRGNLDDALARIARREELERRRAAERPTEHRPAVHEVTEAVRRVVAEHPALAVRMLVDDGTGTFSVRVAWAGGTVTVTPDGSLPSGGTPPVPTAAPSPATSAAPVPVEPPPVPVEPPPVPVETPAPSWPMPARTLPAWTASDQTNGDSAARLAELIRRNPSLLDTHDDR